MTHTLMHKNLPVAELALDEATGSIRRVEALLCREHLPVGVPVRRGAVDRAALNAWWEDRSIPASRTGLGQALAALGASGPKALLARCLGVSLSDHYWLRPAGSTLRWEEENCFQNPFPPHVGDALLGKPSPAGPVDFRSPDGACDGNLPKRWAVLDGKHCLVKAGSAPFHQQPFGEVIAAKVAQRLGIPHIPYWVVWEGGAPFSVCQDFVTPNTELVPAWRVMQTQKKRNQTSLYQHYLQCCQALGVPGVVRALDQMIVLDYLLANEDRHFNNFGLLRNPETLEWLGPAPLFDSGSCLGYNKLPGQIRSGMGVVCKPFKKTHREQLGLVSSFHWLDLSRLDGLQEDIRQAFAGAQALIDAPRVEAIVSAFLHRVQALAAFVQLGPSRRDSAETDVERDVAASYGPL